MHAGDRITITAIDAGSINVRFRIEPDANGGPIAESTVLNNFDRTGISIAGSTTTAAVTAEHMATANPPPPPPPTAPPSRSSRSKTPWTLIIACVSILLGSIGAIVCALVHKHVFGGGTQGKEEGESDVTDFENPMASE